jgi:PAS domain S-box-containing protein
VTSPLDAIPGGILSLAEDLSIVSANEAVAAMVGRVRADLVGQKLDTLLSGPARILFQTHVYPALKADGRVEEVFLTLASQSGRTIPVLLNATRTSGGDGPVYQALIVRILARARWENEILVATRATNEAREASAALAADLEHAIGDLAARHAEVEQRREFRDAFVGIVGHELRTPITTIYGLTQLLRRHHHTLTTEELHQRLEDIESESDRLRQLTEDLLVMSQAEGGRLELATEPTLINHVVRTAVESEQARTPDRRFIASLAAPLPLVNGEPLYLGQVLRNFISNAVKYAPADEPISIATSGESDGVAVRVSDRGPGIGDQDPDRLFDVFYRAPEVVRHAGGAGIGLFVSRELITAMGGRVWARNIGTEAPRGAEFGFWLPSASEIDDIEDR